MLALLLADELGMGLDLVVVPDLLDLEPLLSEWLSLDVPPALTACLLRFEEEDEDDNDGERLVVGGALAPPP